MRRSLALESCATPLLNESASHCLRDLMSEISLFLSARSHTQKSAPKKVGKVTDEFAWQTAQCPVVSVLQHHCLCLAHKAIPQATWEHPNQSATESCQQENNCAPNIALSLNLVSWFSWHTHQTDSSNKSRNVRVWDSRANNESLLGCLYSFAFIYSYILGMSQFSI